MGKEQIPQGKYVTKYGKFGRQFDIYATDYYTENTRLYKNSTIFIPECSIQCIVGCNGIGKSTLIKQMIQARKTSLRNTAWCLDEREKFLYILKDLHREDYEEFYTLGNISTRIGNEENLLFQDLIARGLSTGEKTMYFFGPIFQMLGRETSLLQGKRLFVFLDDLDVGISIDNLREIAESIKTMAAVMSQKGIKYYIIMTANSYELAKNFDCIDGMTLRPISFSNYEEYSDYVCQTADYKVIRNSMKKPNKKSQKNN